MGIEKKSQNFMPRDSASSSRRSSKSAAAAVGGELSDHRAVGRLGFPKLPHQLSRDPVAASPPVGVVVVDSAENSCGSVIFR